MIGRPFFSPETRRQQDKNYTIPSHLSPDLLGAPGAILKPLVTRSTRRRRRRWPLPRPRDAHLPRKVGTCPCAMPIFHVNFVPHECALMSLKKQPQFYLKVAKYEIQKPSTCCAALFGCKF